MTGLLLADDRLMTGWCLPKISKHFRILAWRASDRKSWHHFSLSCHSFRLLFSLKVERYCWQIRNFLCAVWKIDSSHKIIESMKCNVDLFNKKIKVFSQILFRGNWGHLKELNWKFGSEKLIFYVNFYNYSPTLYLSKFLNFWDKILVFWQ